MQAVRLDFVIPCFQEPVNAVLATVGACVTQSGQTTNIIWVVDDGSPAPIDPDSFAADARIRLLRIEHNVGISAARMAAIARSDADYLACVNVDVLPAHDWAAVCLEYLSSHARVGAVFTRLVAANEQQLLSRWRMRFQEQKYDRAEGPAEFAPGHAVLLRRRAIESVGGYDSELRRVGEDSDICVRMRATGWETHFVTRSQCISIQPDTLRYLATKQLLRDGLDPLHPSARTAVPRSISSLANRLGRNLLKGRLSFLLVDLGVFLLELMDLGMRLSVRGRQKAIAPASCNNDEDSRLKHRSNV